MDVAQRMAKTAAIAGVFQPRVPVTSKELLAGRLDQLRELFNTALQPGQHAVVFGERGVGKTSLVNVAYDVLGDQINKPACGPINCDGTMDFSSAWHKAFRECSIGEDKSLDSLLPKVVTPDDIRRVVQNITKAVFVFDEFDQIKDKKASSLMAATIKNLSDHAVDTTIVVVGVADSVDSLIAEHASVERALVQIPMPRMSSDEILEIITTGLRRVGMTITDEAKKRITVLSQGLPYFTHMLSLHAAQAAIGQDRLDMSIEDVRAAIKRSVKQTQQSIVSAYDKAVASANKNNLYRQVLTACALADADDSGYFYAGDVRDPMSKIMNRYYDIPAFAPHISAFCHDDRGPVLKRRGTPKNYQFRFKDPLMQPYVVMRGLDSGLITEDTAFKQ